MTFHTEINIPPSSFIFDHNQKILLIGSCFSVNIGQKLSYHKFDVLINPFGTIYTIHSINKLVQRAISGTFFEKKEFQYNPITETFHHFDLHSDFSKETIEEILEQSNTVLKTVKDQIREVDKIVITLGTSYVFDHSIHGVVANCHKTPQNQFTKKLLSIEHQIAIFDKLFSSIKLVNKKVKCVLTVSPVRHIKEGLSNNSLSKAILRLACESIAEKHDFIEYFPAYEIVVDDLRDYRFMERDLIHPNAAAIDYIWDKFGATYFNAKTTNLNHKIDAIQKDLNHIHNNPNSYIAQKHKDSTRSKIENLIFEEEVLKERF